jgi:hypothetical protein
VRRTVKLASSFCRQVFDVLLGSAVSRAADGNHSIPMRISTSSDAPWNSSRDVTAIAGAESMATVLATRQCDPPGFPALSLPSELGCRAELSLGSYS